MSFVVAIDGPAGTGKGTVTKILAEKLNLINIDTGAMYRCVALDCINKNINSREIDKIAKLMQTITIELKREDNLQKVMLNGVDVTNKIRTTIVDDVVAEFAALKCVREKITPLQRKMKEQGNIIMEGRDIGTTVFPDADVKIYLDASLEERANRRYKQDLEKGFNVTYEEILESIKQRHKLETERELSPLRQAEDAIYITEKKKEEVVEEIIRIIKENMK